MWKDIFGKYNLRARLSPCIILISPILINLYLLFESVRTISTTIIITIVAFAISNLLVLLARYNESKKIRVILDKKVLAQEILSPLDRTIDLSTKKRYYNFLNSKIEDLELNEQLEDEKIIKEKCITAVRWLKEYTRHESEFPLVMEENINTGFCRNLYGLKTHGIFICVILIIMLGIFSIIKFGDLSINISSEIIISVIIDFIYLFLWIFVVNKELINNIYLKYSKALLACCDKK